MAGKGILLDDNNDLKVLNGQLVVGDSVMQEVGIIIQMQTGHLKSAPLLGPNLIQLKKTNLSRFDIDQRLRIHLAMDKKDYKALKRQIELYIQ
jgi:hypothetical protein